MKEAVVRSISPGLSQKGIRNHNERLILSLLQRHGAMPGGDLSRLAGLSPPTVSTILRSLEHDGLITRGAPVRGRVGKPSTPMAIAPDGAFSWGLKIGRRSCDLLLVDFTGTVRLQDRLTYERPLPGTVLAFVEEAVARLSRQLDPADLTRICGVGVAAPFEMWGRRPAVAPFAAWTDTDVRAEIARITGLPVSLMNDATAACRAEHVYGRGRAFRDYAYFFVGAFVGGGIVLNHSVYEGRQGNAGALGSLRSIGPNGESMQLVDMASIHVLEQRLHEGDIDPGVLWQEPQDWSSIARQVEPWLGQTAQELSKAILSTCSVIDFEAVLIDGAFPPAIRDALVERTRRYLANQDTRGLIAPQVEGGVIGSNARGIGAACAPLFAQFMFNTNAGLSVA